MIFSLSDWFVLTSFKSLITILKLLDSIHITIEISLVSYLPTSNAIYKDLQA